MIPTGQEEVSIDSAQCSRALRLAMQKAKEIAVENFLLVGFIIAVILAFSVPVAGALFYSFKAGDFRIIEFLNNCVVFFISGLTLKLDDVSKVLTHRTSIIYGLVTINFVTTLVAFVLQELPFRTKEFAIGLAIFSTVPTTLGVGVALTQLAKGDQVLSLLLTVVSNMLGIITVPFLLDLYMNNSNAIAIDPSALAFKLTLTVLVPSIVGMLVRYVVPCVPEFTKIYKKELSMISTSNLAMIVWMALSTAKDVLMQQNPGEILLVMVTASIVHVFYLVYNRLVTKYILSTPVKQAISIVIMASQKSSPIALAVITNISATGAQKGLLAIPCISGQLMQIFIGSFLARKLAELVVEDAPAAASNAGADAEQAEPQIVPTLDEEGQLEVEVEDSHCVVLDTSIDVNHTSSAVDGIEFTAIPTEVDEA